MKIGKNNPEIGNLGKSYFWAFLFYFHSGTYFGTYLVSYFGPKARNLFSSRPSGSQIKDQEPLENETAGFLCIVVVEHPFAGTQPA